MVRFIRKDGYDRGSHNAKEAKMTDHIDIFDTFVKAKEALEQLPAAQAKIAELEAQLQALHGESTAKDERIASQAEVLSEMDKKLAEVTKERDDATFRELQARDHLENLFKAIHGAADTANKAHAELNPPKPEPEVPLAVETTPDSSATSQTSAENTDANSSHSEQGQSKANPTLDSSKSQGITGGTPATADTNATRPSGDASQFEVAEHDSMATRQYVPVGQSEGPFASTADAQPQAAPSEGGSNAAPTTDTGSVAPQSADASQPKPYWFKPTAMTWNEWEAQGNVIPE